MVKQNLKDPDSYEHIGTTYDDNGDHLRVTMKYRAKNSIGGFVVVRVTAKTNINDGSVLQIITTKMEAITTN